VKADHESSNKLLGASAEERELVNQKVKGMILDGDDDDYDDGDGDDGDGDGDGDDGDDDGVILLMFLVIF